ncbi:MAG: lipopolysaccharide heptosyltransferase I [Sulfuricellaceae bacterium]|nr:lipopolysaccharide heptosyltransferase I [Sulfuricellaceae bacterium]
MSKILLVKTSSMGDVIHALPAVTDIRTHFPDTRIDWMVEEGFAELPRLHPSVDQIIPVALRRWRKQLLGPTTWREFSAFRKQLQSNSYDLILDCQGLIKSALLSLLAHGPRCGFDWRSAREPLASLAADRAIVVDRNLHAVERNRRLAGLALGYTPDFSHIDYGISAPESSFEWLPNQPHAVLLHATSRADKEWPEGAWLALADQLNQMGFCCVLPWGSPAEQARSKRLAAQMKCGVSPPRLNLSQTACLLEKAGIVIGVDTGLTHLAAALKVPLVALYCASDPGLTGVLSSGPFVNLGSMNGAPEVSEVINALSRVLPP